MRGNEGLRSDLRQGLESPRNRIIKTFITIAVSVAVTNTSIESRPGPAAADEEALVPAAEQKFFAWQYGRLVADDCGVRAAD